MCDLIWKAWGVGSGLGLRLGVRVRVRVRVRAKASVLPCGCGRAPAQGLGSVQDPTFRLRMPSAKTIMASATDSQSTCGSYMAEWLGLGLGLGLGIGLRLGLGLGLGCIPWRIPQVQHTGHHMVHRIAHAHTLCIRHGRLACSRFSTKTPVCACARSCRLVDSGLSRSLICSLYSSRYDARTEQVERRPSCVHCAMVAKRVPRVRGNRPEGPGSDHGGAYVENKGGSRPRPACRRPLSAPGRAPGLPQAPASLGHSAAWGRAGHTGLAFHNRVGGASSELGSSASSPEMVKVLPGACESGLRLGLGSGLGPGLGSVASPFQAEEGHRHLSPFGRMRTR